MALESTIQDASPASSTVPSTGNMEMVPHSPLLSTKIHWPFEVTARLVEFYRTQRCLWDPTSRDYKDKILKERVLESFSTQTGFPVEALRKKLVNLRNQFTNEWQKMERSRGVYRTKWAFYRSLLFLKDVVVPRKHRGSSAQFQCGIGGREEASLDLGVDYNVPCPDTSEARSSDFEPVDSEEDASVFSPEVTLEEPSSSGPRQQALDLPPCVPDTALKDPGQGYGPHVTPFFQDDHRDHIEAFTSYIGTELRRIPDEEALGALKLRILQAVFDTQAACAQGT